MAQPDAIASLRERLLDMRAELIAQLADADVLDGGQLTLLGNVGATLLALDLNGSSASRKRGGDYHALGRARRNSGMRELAQLLGAELSLERKAQIIISKSCRYKPSPSDAEGSPERQALYRIATSGLPLPNSAKQIKRIITK